LDVVRILVRHGADARRRYVSGSGFDWGFPLENAVQHKNPIAVIQFLLDSGADPNEASKGSRFIPLRMAYDNGDMAIVNLLLDRGANGVVILHRAAVNGDNELIKRLINRGVQIRSDEGNSALRGATSAGQFHTVQLLVENGVNINSRNSEGNSALNIAYDRGEMEIYNFLLANGAIEFERREVAVQPSTPAPAQSTTVIVQQPTAPAQPAQPQQPPRNVGREIAEAFRSPLQSGTYALAGTQERIRISAIARSGIITQTWQGQNFQGTYNIDGNRMTVQIRGFTFVFNITSQTSFSGHGENWVRIGL